MSDSWQHAAQAWTFQPLAVAAAAAATAAYGRGLIRYRSTRGTRWPRLRTGLFAFGIVLYLCVSCGPMQHYGQRLNWIWVSQILGLLLIVPIFLLTAQPFELAERTAPRGLVSRAAGSRFLQACKSPLVGPALIPLACVGALFGPVPGWSGHFPPVSWTVQLLVLAVGCVIVLPLVSSGDEASSVLVGAAVAVGFVELLIDAVPGIVMRLSTHPVSSFFHHRRSLAGQPTPLHDQQIAGAILWCVAELLDLPFLGLIFLRWLRADAREARVIDATLDAEHNPDEGADEQPWFLSDPQLKDRLR